MPKKKRSSIGIRALIPNAIKQENNYMIGSIDEDKGFISFKQKRIENVTKHNGK